MIARSSETLPQAAASEQPEVRFRIDYLAFTAKGVAAHVVKRELAVIDEEWKLWEVLRRTGRRQRERGPHGSLLEVDWQEKWVHVQIKGQGCGAVGTDALLRLHDRLHARLAGAFAVKRVDVAWDDHAKRIRPEQLRDRFWDRRRKCKMPEVVCKAKRGHFREDDGPEGGCSYTIGERESLRMLRVYDKAAQSGGKVDAIRWELECKDHVAAQVMAAMAGTDDPARRALGFLVGFLDFQEVARGAGGGQRKRCAWWGRFVGEAKRAKLSGKERLEFEEWRRAFVRQNSSGLRLLTFLHGGDLGAAAAEVVEAQAVDNPRHRRWREQVERTRAAVGEVEKVGGGDSAA